MGRPEKDDGWLPPTEEDAAHPAWVPHEPFPYLYHCIMSDLCASASEKVRFATRQDPPTLRGPDVFAEEVVNDWLNDPVLALKAAEEVSRFDPPQASDLSQNTLTLILKKHTNKLN